MGPSTSSIGEDVVMMGGIMASSDAYASRNAVTCKARGRDVAEIPPGSTSSSRDAYASSTLGVRDATEDSCRCCRSRWWGREETEDPCLCCRSRWVGRDEAETALDPPCSCDRRSRLDLRDVREPPTTPGGSIDALEAREPLTTPGGSVEALDCAGEADGDAGDVDTAVTGGAVSGSFSWFLWGRWGRRRCRAASGTGVDTVGVAGGSSDLRSRRRRGAISSVGWGRVFTGAGVPGLGARGEGLLFRRRPL